MTQVYAEAVKSVAELGKTEAGQAAMKQAATDAGKITDVGIKTAEAALHEAQTGEALRAQSKAVSESAKTLAESTETVVEGVEKGAKAARKGFFQTIKDAAASVPETLSSTTDSVISGIKGNVASVLGRSAKDKAAKRAEEEADLEHKIKMKKLEAEAAKSGGKSLIEGAMESSYAGGFLDVKRPSILIALIVIFVLFMILFVGYLYTGESTYRTWLLNTGLLFGTVFVLDQLI